MGEHKLPKGRKAVEPTEPPVVQIAMRQWNGQLATGRPIAVALPTDATDAEIAEVAGWLLTDVTGVYRAEREVRGRLVIARGSIQH